MADMTDQEWFDTFREAQKAREAAGPSAAYREFMTTTPNPPGHAEYMRRAAELYPKLPPGAQQNALWCLEFKGPKAAARYAANAAARWRIVGFKFVMPKASTRGICKHSKHELKERMDRYHAHMAAGAAAEAVRQAAYRKQYDRRLAAALASVPPVSHAAQVSA